MASSVIKNPMNEWKTGTFTPASSVVVNPTYTRLLYSDKLKLAILQIYFTNIPSGLTDLGVINVTPINGQYWSILSHANGGNVYDRAIVNPDKRIIRIGNNISNGFIDITFPLA